MSLDNLWAGWRASYVASVTEPSGGDAAGDALAGERASGADAGGDPATCVFCRIIAWRATDEERHIVFTGECTVVMLNAYPYASGHLLVMPLRHVSVLSDLEEAEATELWSVTRRAAAAIEAAYQPDGLNIGANLGRAAGAGIPRHLHLHALPRWIGDTNFMTTVASTRVMPEGLSDTWEKLRRAWPA